MTTCKEARTSLHFSGDRRIWRPSSLCTRAPLPTASGFERGKCGDPQPNRLHIAVLSHSSASAVVADPVVHLQPHDLFHEPHIIERIEAASAKAFA